MKSHLQNSPARGNCVGHTFHPWFCNKGTALAGPQKRSMDAGLQPLVFHGLLIATHLSATIGLAILFFIRPKMRQGLKAG